MIRVRVYCNYRHAEYWFKAWTRSHEDEIQRIDRWSLRVVLKNGDELHFVPQSTFERWSMGRHWVEENGYES